MALRTLVARCCGQSPLVISRELADQQAHVRRRQLCSLTGDALIRRMDSMPEAPPETSRVWRGERNAAASIDLKDKAEFAQFKVARWMGFQARMSLLNETPLQNA